MKERAKANKLDLVQKGRLVNYLERLCPNKTTMLSDKEIAKGFNKEHNYKITPNSVWYMRKALGISRGFSGSEENGDLKVVVKEILKELRMIRERLVR